MCVKCLPCLESRKLEDAKENCVNGSCGVCGFDKMWKHGVRARIFKYNYDSITSSFVGTINKSSKLAKEMRFETVEWRDYEYKVKPTLATHARQVVQQAAEACPPDQEDLDYEPHDCSTARNLVLVTKRGTMVDFLDHFETKIGIHIQHCNLVSTEHRSKLQYA
jgi:hypothetical protein